MTRIILSNVNTGVAVSQLRYIEIFSVGIDRKQDNDTYGYSEPITDWLDGSNLIIRPARYIFDFKNITKSFLITGLININSPTNASFISVPVTYTETAEGYLYDIAETGGVVTLYIIRSTGTTTYTGIINALSTKENPQNQNHVISSTIASPDVFEVQLTFLVASNG